HLTSRPRRSLHGNHGDGRLPHARPRHETLHADKRQRHREEASVDRELMLPADEQSTEVPQPGEAAFHFVPLLVVLLPRDHRTGALGPPRVGAALSGNTPADTAAPQQVAQVTTIIPTIRYELLGPPIWASTGASDPDGIQRLPGQLHLCAVRTVQVAT